MTQEIEAAVVTDIGAYCRAVEAHLCRMNGGHLVRIVGPAFELVAGWAREGIPERVVLHGVDRTLARLTAKGPRRRPVRIEFCEADVRDAYDQWRRAVGVRATAAGAVHDAGSPADAAPVGARHPSMPKHLERSLVKLSSVAAARPLDDDLAREVAAVIADVDACLDESRGARGDARAGVIARLEAIDRRLTDAAVRALGTEIRAEIDALVRRELAPYREQMPAPVFREAVDALTSDLACRHFGLPRVRLDG